MVDESPRAKTRKQRAVDTDVLVHGFFDLLGGGSLEDAEEVLAPGFINHGGIPAESEGITAFVDSVAALRRAAPKLRIRVSSLKEHGGIVIVRWMATGVPVSWLEDARRRRLAGGHLLRLSEVAVTEAWTLHHSNIDSVVDHYFGDTDYTPTPPTKEPPWIPPEPSDSDPDPSAAATRWIQVQFIDPDAWPKPIPPGDPLPANRIHELDVRIGPERTDWLRAKKPFPDKSLPPNTSSHRLQVVLAEIGGNETLKSSSCDLPPTGPSDVCRFWIQIGTGTFEARIIVLFRNRVIQTARLRAAVGEIAPGSRPMEMVIESVLRPALASLAARTEFDLAFVHDQRPDAASNGTAISRDAVFNLVLKRVEPSVRSIETMLSTVADDPGSYGPDLASEATTRLLYRLALHGVTLRNGFFPEGVPAVLAPPGRIQVLAADPNAYFPIEFVYDFPAPNAPKLCANAESALRAGACQPERFHRSAADGSIDVVCPVGFWSMSRVIERHVTRDQFAADDLRGFDYSLRVEPYRGRDELGGLSAAVFAASQKVTEARLGEVARTLGDATAGHAQRARSWEEWVGAVEASKPTLLLLLAHTVQDDTAGQTALEIETSARCVFGRLNGTYVRSPGGAKPPVVLLLGCETSVPYLEYQSFVVAFRDYGAALVVGTVAAVPSSHAPDVARALVTELKKPSIRSARTFGDVMLAARRALLATGEVMALCLTAYGDADWRLPTGQRGVIDRVRDRVAAGAGR